MSSSATDSLRRVALLSFPKSGRTWLKLMLKVYLERALGVGELPLDDNHRWHEIDGRIPKLIVVHDGDPHFKRAAEIAVDSTRFARFRVMLLVRDPRDIMVSLYFEMTRRTRFYDEWGFDTSRVRADGESLSEFIRGPVGRLDALLEYWRAWAAERDRVERFLLLRYEDMHAAPGGVLSRALDLLGLECLPHAVDYAVDQCRFERMKQAESSGRFDSKTMQPADRGDPDSYKVRRGKVGGYRDYLTASDLEYIDRRCAELPELMACYRGCR